MFEPKIQHNRIMLRVKENKLQNQTYSARLTGNQFLYNEFKVVCGLINSGLNKKEAEEKIKNENLFEYRSLKSVSKHISAVWERANYLDEYLRNIVLKQTNETGRIVNLYAVLKYDLLLFEFMEQVVCEKFCTNQLELTRADISDFFAIKAEQSEIIAAFKEVTLKRLRLSYIEVLQGAGYLKKINGKMELSISAAVYQIADYLESINEKRYAKTMLGKY